MAEHAVGGEEAKSINASGLFAGIGSEKLFLKKQKYRLCKKKFEGNWAEIWTVKSTKSNRKYIAKIEKEKKPKNEGRSMIRRDARYLDLLQGKAKVPIKHDFFTMTI